MKLFFRFWRIFWGIVPPIGIMIRDHHRSLILGDSFDWDHPKRRRRAKQLVDKFAELGPTFIKLAQVLAARADLFPGIYLEELRQLHDRVPPLRTKIILRQFRKAVGREASEVFDDFDSESIASASLGQVHRAVYQGNSVAVKVLKPNIRETVDKDIRIIAWVFSVATVFFQNNQLNSLITVYEQFSTTIHEEMDLDHEAQNIRDFRQRYKNDERVLIPDVIDELSSREVLVLEWMDGVKISDVDAVRAAGHDIPALLDRLVTVFAEQILRDANFHADPHPGNILINERGQLCLLDFGLVVALSEEVRKKYLRGVIAVVQRDPETLVKVAYELGAVSCGANAVVMRQVAERLMQIPLRDDLGPVQMQRIAMQVMQVFYEFPLQLPGELVYVAKTMGLVEGLATLYQPGYNLLRDARESLARILEPELAAIHDSVAERIVNEGKAAWGLYEDAKAIMHAFAREELSVRVCRGDIGEFRRMVGYSVRRLIAAIFFFGVWITGAIVYLNSGFWWALVGGAVIGMTGIVLAFIMPNTPKLPRIILPQRGRVD